MNHGGCGEFRGTPLSDNPIILVFPGRMPVKHGSTSWRVYRIQPPDHACIKYLPAVPQPNAQMQLEIQHRYSIHTIGDAGCGFFWVCPLRLAYPKWTRLSGSRWQLPPRQPLARADYWWHAISHLSETSHLSSHIQTYSITFLMAIATYSMIFHRHIPDHILFWCIFTCHIFPHWSPVINELPGNGKRAAIVVHTKRPDEQIENQMLGWSSWIFPG